MPNRKILQAAAEYRDRMRPAAERVYRRHRAEVPRLIRQLAGPTQAGHDHAFDLLVRMGDTIVSELLAALADPSLDPIAADEVVSLLGGTGDQRAREPVWAFFQAHRDDLERASTAALSLAGLGDERVLPFVREALDAADEEIVANAVASLITIGELEDVHRLRAVHRRHRHNSEIRMGVANAILTILDHTDQHTLSRTLDRIQASFADRELWADIWQLLEEAFG